MAEFKRTLSTVDEVERLVQSLQGSTSSEHDQAKQLAALVGQTDPVVQKFRQKATETDPLKQLYGPQMRERVSELVSRWAVITETAGELLKQRGISVDASAQGASPSNAAPATSVPPSSIRWFRPTPIGGGALAGAASASSSNIPDQDVDMASLDAANSSGDAKQRREQAARADEVRQMAGCAGSAQSPAEYDLDPKQSVGLPVNRMEDLLELANSAFVGHGFKPSASPLAPHACVSGATRISYNRNEGEGAQVVKVTFVTVQSHLVIYASSSDNGLGMEEMSIRTAVQLGMAASSVQAKVDYLIVYPLVSRQFAPTLVSVPPEVCFCLLMGLALPALAALGAASHGMARAVFEDDALWTGIVLALPPNETLKGEIDRVRDRDRNAQYFPASVCRSIVQAEVRRCRTAAERDRKRQEDEYAQRASMRRLIREVRPPRGIPGRPGFLGGHHDLMPGGGFMPPFGGGFGGRRPFGGPGGFGGGMM